MLTRIKSGNITDFQVLKEDLGNNVVDGYKLDVPSQGSPGHVLTTDGSGNLSFAPVGGTPIALDTLTDVDTTGAQFGDVLKFDGAGNWVPSSSLQSGIFLNSLEDVVITSPVAAHVLRYDGSNFVNARVNVTDILNIAPVAITNQINSLSDVNTVGATGGQVLKFIGGQWVPASGLTIGSITQLDDVSTTAAGDGDALVFNGVSGQWEPVDIGVAPASSNTFVVDTIIERDSLTPAPGDQVFVRTGTDGEWQFYLWEGSQYYLISTADVATTDANTIEAIVTPLTISPVLLGNISSGSRVTLVTIDVTAPFDGSPTLTVGDSGDNSRLVDNTLHDLSMTGSYSITTDFVYSSSLDTDIFGYFSAGGATVGEARIVVTYV